MNGPPAHLPGSVSGPPAWIDNRFDYGEERIVTLGLGQRQILYVVSTERNENCIRLISVRRAEKDEIERYDLGRS